MDRCVLYPVSIMCKIAYLEAVGEKRGGRNVRLKSGVDEWLALHILFPGENLDLTSNPHYCSPLIRTDVELQLKGSPKSFLRKYLAGKLKKILWKERK